MKIEKLDKRVPLREHLTHAEKCTRDLIEHVQNNMVTSTADLRDLSRLVRRKSHYPTLIAILNALHKVKKAGEEAMIFTDYLLEELQDIRKASEAEQSVPIGGRRVKPSRPKEK